MTLLSIARLTVERQRAVGSVVSALLDPVLSRPKAFPTIAEKAQEFLQAHNALLQVQKFPKLAIDNAADRCYGAAFLTLRSIVRTFTLTAVPLSPSAVRRRDAAQRLLDLAFPRGTNFLHRPMDLQFTEMRSVVRALRSHSAAESVKILSFGDTIDVLEAFLEPYGVAAHSTDGSDLEELSARWHDAFVSLAAVLVGTSPINDPLRGSILGAYEKSLTAQSTKAHTRRRRSSSTETPSAKSPTDPISSS